MERVLRDVVDGDIPIFFEQQNDPEAIEMAAFPPREWEPFRAHWARIRQDETCITKTIVSEGRVAGNIGSFPRDDRRYVGYWLGREFWGQGLATRALAELVEELERPLYAEVSTANIGSIRVLEKCGFKRIGTVVEQHEALGGDLELLVMELVG
ncbi:MAG TPA: GNAT family N-acetyltransferase [Gaiellaceae bacterium]|jgi:RimJ/RimL family protein N-acetyltransferase